MSTTTTNLGLVKPEYTDTADVQVINQNMDKIDGATGSVMGSLAIIANGNTHAAIPAGQFVYVRNHSSLSEGLYQATAAIATNATLSTSNLTAVSGGGLNAICCILKTPGMFNKLTVTVTTTALGNAVFTELRASNIIVGIRPPAGVICAGIGRSADGWPLARIADTANNVLTETEVTLDIYYI